MIMSRNQAMHFSKVKSSDKIGKHIYKFSPSGCLLMSYLVVKNKFGSIPTSLVFDSYVAIVLDDPESYFRSYTKHLHGCKPRWNCVNEFTRKNKNELQRYNKDVKAITFTLV